MADTRSFEQRQVDMGFPDKDLVVVGSEVLAMYRHKISKLNMRIEELEKELNAFKQSR